LTDSTVTTSATFVPSPHVSGSTNLPDGIVHIFRAEPTRPSHTPSLSAASEPSASNDPLSRGNTEKWDGVTLGVLSVPSWMTPADFLAFVAPAAEGLKHLRIIR
jgi:BRCA1-associated protein